MQIVSQGTISGPEARGRVVLTTDDHGVTTVGLSELWVAPGAPDVRLFVTSRREVVVDEDAVDLGHIPDGVASHETRLPDGIEPATLSTVIVYCKVYSVLFGSASLDAPMSREDTGA